MRQVDKLGQERCDIRTGEDKWGKTQGQNEKRKTKCREDVRQKRKHTGQEQKSNAKFWVKTGQPGRVAE